MSCNEEKEIIQILCSLFTCTLFVSFQHNTKNVVAYHPKSARFDLSLELDWRQPRTGLMLPLFNDELDKLLFRTCCQVVNTLGDSRSMALRVVEGLQPPAGLAPALGVFRYLLMLVGLGVEGVSVVVDLLWRPADTLLSLVDFVWAKVSLGFQHTLT